MKNVQENLTNLTSLWSTVGKSFNTFTDRDNLQSSYLKNAQWPNRIWTHKKVTLHDVVLIQQRMQKNPLSVFSYFKTSQNSEVVLTQHGFSLKSVQYGMSLPLQQTYQTTKNLHVVTINNEREAELWSATFKKAFGYYISPEIIVKTQNLIPYALVYEANQLIGTFILYITNHTAGIHSLGILPEMRKKGYATEIMLYVLNLAQQLKAELVTLQASEMAKNIYLKLGFSLDFMMENYEVSTHKK